MVDQNLIKRLICFVDNLEQKLSSVNIIHDKLYELMSIVSKTHETIVEDLTNIKKVLNETTNEQEEDEITSVDATKSEWDDDDDEDDEVIESKKSNKNDHQSDNLTLNSASTNDSSSTSKRSSSLKKSDQLTSTIKSPKSVGFSTEKNTHNQTQKRFITPFQQFSNEKKNLTFNEIRTSITPSSSSDLLKQNQFDLKPNIGKTLTNVRIHEIESKNGDYLRLLNVSNSDDYDLSEHFLEQYIDSKRICRFQFPFHTIIRAGQTITIWCGRFKGINPQPPHVFLWKEQTKWETRPECTTILAKPNGQSIGWYRKCRHLNTDHSSDDILFVHSKVNLGSFDVFSTLSNSIKSASRPSTRLSAFSGFNIFGNTKPPFAHSPDNPIHPNHNGTTVNIPNDIRSQMHQKGTMSRLLSRPKSSPFSNHTGCKQDLISMNILRTQQQKQTTVKNLITFFRLIKKIMFSYL